MDCVAASLHRGDGTPRPSRQMASPVSPAALAAARICAAACGLGDPLVVLAAASERFDVVQELLAVEGSGLESALPAEYV